MLALNFITAGYVGRPALRTPQQSLLRPTRASSCMMAGKVVVTDGSGDNFYGSRTVFQMLHDYGDFSAITVRHDGARNCHCRLPHAAHLRIARAAWQASSSSTANAKKMLLSRQVGCLPSAHALLRSRAEPLW